jgi:hypothetical protein
MPVVEGLPTSTEELPAIVSFAILHRMKIDSFNELPKDKRPPRDLWDKQSKLDEFFDEVFEVDKSKSNKQFIPFNSEEVE